MLYLLLIIYTPLKRAGHMTGSFILLMFFIFINPKASHTLLTAVALNNKSPVYCRSLYSSKLYLLLTLNALGGHADSQLLGQCYRVHKQPLTIESPI